MEFKINVEELLKGIVLAIVLMVGMALGVLLRVEGVNGFIIWFVVSLINIGAAIFAYIFIKKELAKKPIEAIPTPETDKKSGKKKKNMAESDEKEENTESEDKKFETPADKKE
jgi:phosphate/sulfate permease